MSSTYGMYSACYASAESHDAFEAQAQYAQSFWSPAGQPAFHNYQMFAQYSDDQAAMTAWPQHAYQSQPDAGKHAAMQCGVNLDDYSDFSDTDSESSPSTPAAVLVMSKDLHKSISEDHIAPDDSNSTDVASSDAVSISNASDESDIDSDSCPTPKSSKCVYSLDAMMLIRMAVGVCASPAVKWSTQPIKKASGSGEGCEWRREAAGQQSRGSGSMKLVASATSWAAQQALARSQGSASAGTVTDEEVTRSVKSILNKLTIEKFDTLYAKLIACGISKDQHVQLLVQEVFEKACLQHHFIDMYADLCMKLETFLDDSKTDATATGFRRILLNQCQKSFEDSLQAPAKVDQEMAEDERLELETRHKQRVLGNTRFIGALLTRGMLSPRVLIFCANELLKNEAGPDALESLAALLTAVGPTFDDKEWSSHGLLCDIFDRVKGLTKDKQVPARLRFLLADVLDLRATKWANMKKATAKQTGPMKLEEVQKQAAQEEAQAQKRSNVPKSNQIGQKKNSAPASDLKQNGSPKQKQGAEEPRAKALLSKKALTSTKSPACPSGKKTQNNQPLSPTLSPKAVSSPPVATGLKASCAAESSPRTEPFDLRTFRRELTDVLKELGATRDIVRARGRFAGVQIPAKLQAGEFSNLLTRVAEERCSATRRAMFAFVAGLAGSVFDKDKCADGIQSFFDDVFDDLSEEVPRLPEILKTEFVPTIRAALPAHLLSKILPAALK